MQIRDLLMTDWQAFILLWAVHLGDKLEVLDNGRVTSDIFRLVADQVVRDDVLIRLEELGLIEFRLGDDGEPVTVTTERGRHNLHIAGVRRMGQHKWMNKQRNLAWIMRGFAMEEAIRDMIREERDRIEAANAARRAG